MRPLATLLSIFGDPHSHHGRSVRALRQNLYETRAGLSLRVVFVRQGEILRVDFVGTHDEVKAYLRNTR